MERQRNGIHTGTAQREAVCASKEEVVKNPVNLKNKNPHLQPELEDGDLYHICLISRKRKAEVLPDVHA